MRCREENWETLPWCSSVSALAVTGNNGSIYLLTLRICFAGYWVPLCNALPSMCRFHSTHLEPPCVCVCGGGLDSSVPDPLPVRAVGSVWPRDRLSSAGMVVFYLVRFLVLENLRHFTLFGRFSFLTHPLCFWLSVAGILYDEILCDEIWLWKGRIGRQGITKECVSSLSPLANEKLQADSVSDNDILGENPGIKICSCILNWPHPPHNNDSVLQVNSSREHLTINQKTAVSSLICSQHSTFAPRLTARFGQCPISFEIWYSLGNGH